jgi:5,10-methylenetetrahydromethanopterin reductase
MTNEEPAVHAGESSALRTAVWTFPNKPVAELVRAAQIAEAAGVDTFWVGDEGPAREAFTVLTAVGIATTSINLGVAVTNPYLRHPALTASTAATVAEATGRRLHLGYGPGGSVCLGPVGLKPIRAAHRIGAAIELSRSVLRAEATAGFEPGPFATPQPLVDIWVASRSRMTTSLAGEKADGFFASTIKPRLGELIGWLRSGDRPVELSLCFPLVSDEQHREAIRPFLSLMLLDAPPGTAEAAGMSTEAARAAAAAVERGDLEAAARLTPDEALDAATIGGSAASTSAEFADLAITHAADEITVALFQDDVASEVERAAGVLLAATELVTNRSGPA